ncbi:hypothetical protein HN51_069283 [Arachis hypogaea]|uniref:non-specific serine/threonine protein kinase n=1 Tax=Arachis hypogaea TaxID=3818 RepID=A0A444Z6U5_ARAHY|nr:proline-rich receptor-like protein kinase PERK2 [Arachis ipaensis]RYR09891.1 hypothetical protein Ahy_B05g078323 [Arachis hypogaea]
MAIHDHSSNVTPSSFSDSSNFSSPPSPHASDSFRRSLKKKSDSNSSSDDPSPKPSPRPPRSPPPPKSPPRPSKSPPPPPSPRPPKHSPPPKTPPPPPSPVPSPPPPRVTPPPPPTSITPPDSHFTPPQVTPSHPPPPPPPPPPPLPPTTSSPPNHPTTPPQSPSPPSRSGGDSSSSKRHSPPASSTSNTRGYSDRIGQHVGFAVAAISIIALIAVILFFFFRKKKDRGDAGWPQGGNVHYYYKQPGGANGPQVGMYGSQKKQSTPVRGYYGGYVRSPSELQQMSGGIMAYSYEEIVEVTNGFSSENVIGEGGFGSVYKALMPDGRVGAVKMLKPGSGQGEREFRAEVDIISRIHHRHLVSLIGYCIAEQHRVLVYEFVPNGNLSQHLHGNNLPVLDWPNRMKIANGAARGIAYLHEGCNPRIIHRDIKSANILLDGAYEAQVADFGLAKLTDDANTHVSTRVMGTFGYMAPEYATSGKLTDRSDVFSFGVVLLELITGRKPVDPKRPIGEESLVEWARPHLLLAMGTRAFGDLEDPRLQGRYVHSEMLIMIEAAAACVRHSAPKRPRMVQVARALECGEQLDLSNGVKYGQSRIYDSSQYINDIMRFRRMMADGNFSGYDYDMYSTEHSSRELSPSLGMPTSSGGNSEPRSFNNHRSFSESEQP